MFTLDPEPKKLVADVCEQYDIIADANELNLPYITGVYGKSKTHFIRLIGCLAAIETTFKVIALINPIPTEKSEFITEVHNKLAEFPDRNSITVEVVKMAMMVSDYFISHKLIMSNLEKTDSGEFRFIQNAGDISPDSNLTSSNTPRSNLKKNISPISLELRILRTPGPIVFLSPLSSGRFAQKESFTVACDVLNKKGLGAIGKYPADENAPRNATGFKKTSPCELNELTLTNSLLDFGCTLPEFVATLTQNNIVSTQTTPKTKQTASKSKSIKRSLGETSLQNIAAVAKTSKQDEAVESENDEDDE